MVSSNLTFDIYKSNNQRSNITQSKDSVGCRRSFILYLNYDTTCKTTHRHALVIPFLLFVHFKPKLMAMIRKRLSSPNAGAFKLY